jgi:hypothetical protein
MSWPTTSLAVLATGRGSHRWEFGCPKGRAEPYFGHRVERCGGVGVVCPDPVPHVGDLGIGFGTDVGERTEVGVVVVGRGFETPGIGHALLHRLQSLQQTSVVAGVGSCRSLVDRGTEARLTKAYWTGHDAFHELEHRRPGCDAESRQELSILGPDLNGLDWTTRLMERGHQLAPEPLTKRMQRYEILEHWHGRPVFAELELGFVQVFVGD